MELAENLKKTLDKTYQLAVGLEQVSSMIYPRKIGAQGRKRLISINREIKNLSQMMRIKTAPSQDRSRNNNSLKRRSSQKPEEFIPDSPGYLMKKRLSLSIKEINERVKMSRAGKRMVGKYISKGASSPPIIKNIESLHNSWQERIKTPKTIGFDISEEKPQPYVPLTSGKIEDPIVLPTFEEFLEAKGVEFMVRKGKDELFYRIEKAMEQLGKLRDTLDTKLANWNSNIDKKFKHRKGTQFKIYPNVHKPESFAVEKKKNNDLRALINQYYEMPIFYNNSHRYSKSVHIKNNENFLSLSSEAEGGLEESLRNFYWSKANENKKLTDILEKIAVDRPNSIKDKITLIQEDKEKYKNKHHSIEKFNEFREIVELKKRERQYKSFQQAIIYLEILDEFKRKRYEPKDSELLLLELWRRMAEGGWVISHHDLDEMSSILSDEEKSNKAVQFLLEKFSSIC